MKKSELSAELTLHLQVIDQTSKRRAPIALTHCSNLQCEELATGRTYTGAAAINALTDSTVGELRDLSVMAPAGSAIGREIMRQIDQWNSWRRTALMFCKH